MTLYDGDVCFVPTFSALDLPATTPATAYAKYINGQTDNTATRVGNPAIGRFIAQEQSGSLFSLTHLRYTARNSEWLFNEFQRPYAAPGTNPNPLACPSNPQECSVPTLITGPPTLCGTTTYATTVQGPGLTYTWTASPASAFTVSSGSGPTFTTGNSGSSSDYGTITLQIGGDCPLTLTKQVKLGSPEPPSFQAQGAFDGCTANQFATFQLDNYDASLSYALSASGGIHLRNQLQPDGTFNVKGGGAGGTITVTASNSCGTVTTQNSYSFAPCDGFVVYPNPGDDDVAVYDAGSPAAAQGRAPAARNTISANATSDADDTPLTVRVYDSYGRLRFRRQGSRQAGVHLATATLPVGFYVLHMVQAGTVLGRQQLQILR